MSSEATYYGDKPSWLEDASTPSAPPSTEMVSTSTTSVTSASQRSAGVSMQDVNVYDDDNSNNNTNNTNSYGKDALQPGAKTWSEFWSRSFQRDGRTLLITIFILVAVNLPYINWALYPFRLFSTWIHEMCHGMAALFLGGTIDKLEVFADTSGLAHVRIPFEQYDDHWGVVVSAGYQGTPVVGMLLLLVRRTKRAPRFCTALIGLFMILTVIIWIRNFFGIVSLLVMGVGFVAASFTLSSTWMQNFFIVTAVTCALNAVTSIRALFSDEAYVNGQPVTTDANAMADDVGGSPAVWATTWFFLGLVLAAIGWVFALPGPNQQADFTFCVKLQDCGCFYICNAPGQRCCSSFFGWGGGQRQQQGRSDNNDTNSDRPPRVSESGGSVI